jgi:hypothetical protein
MANNPKKVKDPTEVALSAIQEALNINDLGESDNSGGSAHAEVALPPASTFSEPSFEVRPDSDSPSFEPIGEIRQSRRPANDDRETIGQILQAIQKGRPARNVYTFATIFAGVWLVGCGLLTFSFLPSRRCSLRPSFCSISSQASPGAARNCG